MAFYDFDIGIVEGGAAGLTIASGSAQLGGRVDTCGCWQGP